LGTAAQRLRAAAVSEVMVSFQNTRPEFPLVWAKKYSLLAYDRIVEPIVSKLHLRSGEYSRRPHRETDSLRKSSGCGTAIDTLRLGLSVNEKHSATERHGATRRCKIICKSGLCVESSNRYRQFARECLAIARTIEDERARAALVQMADAWVRIAEKRDDKERDQAD
jgi:hypothetical protein